MLFNSYSFLLFFAIVLAVHYSRLAWTAKKTFLLLASYLFYAAWNPPFVLLLWISTIADWILAKRIYQADSTATRRSYLVASLCVNLGLLGFFKYGGFFLDNFISFCAVLGIAYQPPDWNVILPVGISFYTFQTLSYTIDVYRRKITPSESFLDFALFVTFFPQLVAGPIVRAAEFLPQCQSEKRAGESEFGYGLALLVTGLFQKVVLADGLFAPIVEQIYDASLTPTTAAAWSATLAFAGQIYCDFAGYSNCAIGVAMCLGFSLTENFRFPYAAIGFSDFWRRWHISLSTWLRDYLYTPLGGNRQSRLFTLRNLMITMFLGGLWHGAAWTFVIWGLLHGTYLIVERLARQSRFADMRLWETSAGVGLLWLSTFVAVCFAWVFFRANSLNHAGLICSSMLGFGQTGNIVSLGEQRLLVGLTAAPLLVLHHLWMRDFDLESMQKAANRIAWPARSAALAAMLVAITLMPGSDRAFIYFQF